MKRSTKYEDKFRAYLFKGDADRFKNICENIGITSNIKTLNEVE